MLSPNESYLATCARLCTMSYLDDAVQLGFVEVGDLCYGTFDTPHGQIVCIRGSKEPYNWLRNVRAVPWRTCAGNVGHKGFIRAYQDLCAAGMPTAKNPHVSYIGHSLGGGIATAGAEHTGGKLVTFGAPKFYFRFASAPVLRHIRVVRDDDPIPWVPGAFYAQRCEPFMLKDNDHCILQVKDHFMQGYERCILTKELTYEGVPVVAADLNHDWLLNRQLQLHRGQ